MICSDDYGRGGWDSRTFIAIAFGKRSTLVLSLVLSVVVPKLRGNLEEHEKSTKRRGVLVENWS